MSMEPTLLRVTAMNPVLLDFSRDVYDTFVLLGCYATYIGSQLQTFRNKLSVPASKVTLTKNILVVTDVSGQIVGSIFKGEAACLDCLTLEYGTDSLPEMPITNYQYTLPNIPEEQMSETMQFNTTRAFNLRKLAPKNIHTTVNDLMF